MEAMLHFIITKVDGTVITQDLGCPPDAAQQILQQAFAQYSQIGVMKKEGNKYTLVPSAQIAFVEVELPTLIIATEADAKGAAKASESLKKIISI